MKKFLILFILLNCTFSYSQCDIKLTQRPDGNDVKYFNPKPVIRLKDYEVGISLFKNVTTNKWFLSVSMLFLNMYPDDIEGNLTIQTTNPKSLVLKLVESQQLEMNGRKLSVALFEIDERSKAVLQAAAIKSMFFYLSGKMHGATLTENKSIISKQFSCLNQK